MYSMYMQFVVFCSIQNNILFNKNYFSILLIKFYEKYHLYVYFLLSLFLQHKEARKCGLTFKIRLRMRHVTLLAFDSSSGKSGISIPKLKLLYKGVKCNKRNLLDKLIKN